MIIRKYLFLLDYYDSHDSESPERSNSSPIPALIAALRPPVRDYSALPFARERIAC
jgi:hypothetical protein